MGKLDRDQVARKRVIDALNAGASVAAAARAGKVTRDTVYKWERRGGDEDLVRALEVARASGGRGRKPTPQPDATPVDAATAAALRGLALGRLEKILRDDKAEASTHVAAAKVALGVTTPRPGAVAAPAPVDHEGERQRALATARALIAGRSP